MSKVNWLKEEVAAEKIGYRPRVLRRHVKAGRLNIAYTNLNGRAFQYLERDIDRVLMANSTFIK